MVVPCMTPSSVSSTLLGSPSRAFSPPASLVAYLAISTSREETLQSALLAAGPRGATPRVFQHGRRCGPNWRQGAWSSKRFLSGTARCADHFPALRFTERGPGGHEHWPFASLVSMLLVRRPCASIDSLLQVHSWATPEANDMETNLSQTSPTHVRAETLTSVPLSPAIGAEIVGVDLRAPLDDAQFEAILEAWHQSCV